MPIQIEKPSATGFNITDRRDACFLYSSLPFGFSSLIGKNSANKIKKPREMSNVIWKTFRKGERLADGR